MLAECCYCNQQVIQQWIHEGNDSSGYDNYTDGHNELQ